MEIQNLYGADRTKLLTIVLPRSVFLDIFIEEESFSDRVDLKLDFMKPESPFFSYYQHRVRMHQWHMHQEAEHQNFQQMHFAAMNDVCFLSISEIS